MGIRPGGLPYRIWPYTVGATETPAPFAQDDWPNPQLQKQGGFLHVGGSLLVTTLAIPFFAATFAAPYAAKPVNEGAWVQNLQATTLAPAVAANPFVPSGWSVPGPAGRQGVDIAPNLLTSALNATTQQPQNRQSDWPNPTRATWRDAQTSENLQLPRFPAVNPAVTPLSNQALTWVRVQGTQQPLPGPNLQGTTLQAAAASPFVPLDWTAPRTLNGQAAWLGPTPLGFTLAQPFAPAPGAQAAAKWTPLAADAQNTLVGTLYQTATIPQIRQADWPNPIAPWVRQAQIPPNVLIPLRPEVNPFSELDWPNPRPVAVQQPFEFQNLQQDEIAVPFAQTDWPNPRPLRIQPSEQTLNGQIVPDPHDVFAAGIASSEAFGAPGLDIPGAYNFLVSVVVPPQRARRAEVRGAGRIVSAEVFGRPQVGAVVGAAGVRGLSGMGRAALRPGVIWADEEFLLFCA